MNLAVERGEIFCLVGPSGCGKSTLLRCLAGLDAFDRGRIFFDGAPVGSGDGFDAAVLAALRRRVGMVFQDLQLFPHRTALENVSLAPRVVLRESPEAASARARDLLARVGLGGLEDRYPAALSGGQKQRVAIARALAMRPEVLLYDEPTSALDPELVGEVASLMRSLKSDGLTQIVVTHEMRFTREAADRVGRLQDGRIADSGAPAEVFGRALGG